MLATDNVCLECCKYHMYIFQTQVPYLLALASGQIRIITPEKLLVGGDLYYGIGCGFLKSLAQHRYLFC